MKKNNLDKNNSERKQPMPPIVPRARKAFMNEDYLNSREARILRILSEYQYPEIHFEKSRISKTINFFGSARIYSPEQLSALQRDIEQLRGEHPDSQQIPVLEQQLRRVSGYVRYYNEAMELSRLLTEWTMQFPPDERYVICSGGGPGIMEAANRGSFLAGGQSIGMNISLPHEQLPNRYITPYLNFEFHYFFTRKYWFMSHAEALIVFPGGFGTFDELFESLTLVQTGKKHPMPIILYGEEFWKNIMNIEALAETGMISQEDLSLFRYENSPEEAFKNLVQQLS